MSDLPAGSDRVRVKFWSCPDRSHRFVEWNGDIATCPTCGSTNEALSSHSWERTNHEGPMVLRCSACGYVWKSGDLGPTDFCPNGKDVGGRDC